MSTEVQLWLYHRATHMERIAVRHNDFLKNMHRIGPPLGLGEGLVMPSRQGMFVLYDVAYPIEGLTLDGLYIDRNDRRLYSDSAACDDKAWIQFNVGNPALDYPAILREHFPKAVEAFGAYRANAALGLHGHRYEGGQERSNPRYNELATDTSVDINGRNNIYTLEPAQYWDAELCRRALGYGPDEVMRRLKSEALLVEPLMNGVYVVLNDDPDLGYDAFVAMNERYKAILGIE